MGLRNQDPIPEWITHLAVVKGNGVLTGTKEQMLQAIGTKQGVAPPSNTNVVDIGRGDGKAVVVLKNVNVTYDTRRVPPFSSVVDRSWLIVC